MEGKSMDMTIEIESKDTIEELIWRELQRLEKSHSALKECKVSYGKTLFAKGAENIFNVTIKMKLKNEKWVTITVSPPLHDEHPQGIRKVIRQAFMIAEKKLGGEKFDLSSNYFW